MADFPYLIIYQAMEDEIRILVLRHQSRDPLHGDGRR